MLGLPRITTSHMLTISFKSNSVSLCLLRYRRPNIHEIAKRSLSTIKPNPGIIPQTPKRGTWSKPVKTVSMVSALVAIGMGGYYTYKNTDDGEIGEISKYLKSLVYPEANKNTSQIPFSNKDTKVEIIEVNKSDEVTEKSQTIPKLTQETKVLNGTTDITEKEDNKQSLPNVPETKAAEKTSKEVEEKPKEPVVIEEKNETKQEIPEITPAVTPVIKEEIIPRKREPLPYDASNIKEKIAEHSEKISSTTKSEEIADSEYPFVLKNSKKEDTISETVRLKAILYFQIFLEGKDKLTENIQSQTLERQRIRDNPNDNTVSKECLTSLESIQTELQAEYNTAKSYALNAMRELYKFENETATEYQSKISSADQTLSHQLLKLNSDKFSYIDTSPMGHDSKISKLTAKIESLENQLSLMRRERLEREDELEKKYNDSLNSQEMETKRMMYQLIETHHDHMATRLTEHAGELNKQWEQVLEELASEESVKYQKEKSGILSRLKGISDGIDRSESSVKETKKFNFVLSLVNELREFIDKKEQTSPQKIFIKQRIDTLCEYLHEQPELIELLREVPSRVLVHGLVSKPWIIEGFRGIERSCHRLAYVEDEEKLSSYVKSYFRSLITPVRATNTDDLDSSQSELSNPVMIRSATDCVQRGDLYTAARLMNNLSGAARTEASHWVRDTVSYLETEQVIRVLYWYLTASIIAAAK